MKSMISPCSARHARLLRLTRQLCASGAAGVPKSDGEQMVWVNSHIRAENDKKHSKDEEALREPMIPTGVGENSIATHGQSTHGNLFHFREYPMYPGEYVPPHHNTLSSLRDELRFDISAQAIKDAWMRVSGGNFFPSVDSYYASVDGIDAEQLGEIISATLPGFNRYESKALVTRVLELLSKPSDSPARQLGRTISAEAVGLDNAPGHYTNFLEWMGRLTETRAFKTEHALFQFSRRKFNRKDVQVMNENYKLMSRAALQQASSDSYSHFYSVLKDFSIKVSGEDTRHQIGVRVDDAEYDHVTGMSVGRGEGDGRKYIFTALLRENKDHNGSVTLQGRPLNVAFDDQSWLMEMVLHPFDEANLDVRDFDMSIISEGKAAPSIANEIAASTVRLAVANAIAKLMPLTRIPLKKAGLLSQDRRAEPGQFPGYLDKKKTHRRFAKR
jgi:ribosomal protein S9